MDHPAILFTLAFLPLCASTAPAQSQSISTEDPRVPSNNELLKWLNGDFEERLTALRYARHMLHSPELFFDHVAACTDHDEIMIRRKATIAIGQFVSWNPSRASGLLLSLSRDEDERVRYNSVCYGLSTIQDASDPVIDRLIEIIAVTEDQEKRKGLIRRILHCLKPCADRAAIRIRRRVHQLDTRDIHAARELTLFMYELTGQISLDLARFADTGKYVVFFGISKNYQPVSEADIEQRLRIRLGSQISIDHLRVGVDEGDFAGNLVTTGIHNYAAILNEFATRNEFLTSAQHNILLDELSVDDRARVTDRIKTWPAHSSFSQRAIYDREFRTLLDVLARDYAHSTLKAIDWASIKADFLPRSSDIPTRARFCLLCQELVACLEDSHAYVTAGEFDPVSPPLPRWDPGFACLIDDQGRPVVYFVDAGSPAEVAGLCVGMTVLELNGLPVEEVIAKQASVVGKYVGYSSERLLRYHTARSFARQTQRNHVIHVVVKDVAGI